MGIFMRNYNKPGKGVDPLAPKSEGAMLFFEIFFRKFWKLIQVNLLYCVALIPTFIIMFMLAGAVSNSVLTTFGDQIASLVGLQTPDFNNSDFNMIYVVIDVCLRAFVSVLFTVFWGMGPATAGMHYIMRNYSREENAFILSDFWDAVKDNFKQSLFVFIVDVIMLFVFFYAITFYATQTNILKYAKYLVYCLFLFYTMLHLFLYPLMVRYKLTIGKLYRNAALFCLVSLPYSILVIILLLALTVGLVYLGIFVLSSSVFTTFITVFLLYALLLLYSLCGFIVSFNAERQIIRHLDENAVVEEKPIREDK
ncbi:MAG: YesL family protein [Clostridiales bacterium]|nr:YesL family protein [Clostridiales bacterium]